MIKLYSAPLYVVCYAALKGPELLKYLHPYESVVRFFLSRRKSARREGLSHISTYIRIPHANIIFCCQGWKFCYVWYVCQKIFSYLSLGFHRKFLFYSNIGFILISWVVLWFWFYLQKLYVHNFERPEQLKTTRSVNFELEKGAITGVVGYFIKKIILSSN